MRCGVLGGFLIGCIGVLLPPVMFWGEFEINTLANPSRRLPHIWPQVGAMHQGSPLPAESPCLMCTAAWSCRGRACCILHMGDPSPCCEILCCHRSMPD